MNNEKKKLDYFSKLDKVRETISKQKEKLAAKKAEKSRQIRLADLSAKVHKVGNIVLPLPTVLAMDFVEEYFGSLDKISLENAKHVFTIVWAFENVNENNVDAIANMSKKDIEIAVKKRMAQVSAVNVLFNEQSKLSISEFNSYVLAVEDIFTMIKKNSLQDQIQVLENTLKVLDSSPILPKDALI